MHLKDRYPLSHCSKGVNSAHNGDSSNKHKTQTSDFSTMKSTVKENPCCIYLSQFDKFPVSPQFFKLSL